VIQYARIAAGAIEIRCGDRRRGKSEQEQAFGANVARARVRDLGDDVR
jgi:hypothetical protein